VNLNIRQRVMKGARQRPAALQARALHLRSLSLHAAWQSASTPCSSWSDLAMPVFCGRARIALM